MKLRRLPGKSEPAQQKNRHWVAFTCSLASASVLVLLFSISQRVLFVQGLVADIAFGVLGASLAAAIIMAFKASLALRAGHVFLRHQGQASRSVHEEMIAIGPPSANRTFSLRLLHTGHIFPNIAQAMANHIANHMLSSGFIESPLLVAARHLGLSLIMLAVTMPSAVALYLLFKEPLVLLLPALAGLPLLTWRFSVSSKLGDRRRGVEEELPYFAMFAAIMESAGLTLFNACQRVVGSRLFRYIEGEASLILRENMFFGRSPIEALEARALSQQSDRFRSFILGYSSILRGGGDVARYLDSKAHEYLGWLQFRWRRYAESAADIGEMVVAVFFALPLLLISIIFVFPTQVLDIVQLTIGVVVPTLAVAAYGVIVSAQPKIKNDLQVPRLFPMVLGAAVAATVIMFTFSVHPLPFHQILAIVLLGFTVPYGVSTLRQLREINNMEKAVPAFLRDITEFRKIGYDITKGVIRLSRERRYNYTFDILLSDIARQLEVGSRMKEVYVKTRSWLARMTFHILAEVVETGGGTPTLLENFTEFVERIVTVKRETRASMRLYEALAYATPIGLAFTIGLMQFMMGQFTGILQQGTETGLLSGLASPAPPEVIEGTRILVIEAAFAVSMLATKAVDLTAKHTLKVSANVTAGLVAILFAGIVLPLLPV